MAWQKIQGADPEGHYYLDDSGNVYISKSSGPQLVTDPWTKKYKQAVREKQFQRDLSVYDAASKGFVNNAVRDFNTVATVQGARQAGAVSAATGLEGQRRGLGSEFTAALSQRGSEMLGSQVLDANLTFGQRLRLAAGQDRMGFINREFSFFHGLETLELQAELSKDLARFQAQLQSDLNSQKIFGDMLGTLFTVVGLAAFGPPGAAAGAGVGIALSGKNGAGGVRGPDW